MDAVLNRGRKLYLLLLQELSGHLLVELLQRKSKVIDFFNEYESSKAKAEDLVRSYVSEKNLDAVIVLPTRVYGNYLLGEPASVSAIKNT